MPKTKRSPVWDDPRVKPPYGSVEVDWGHPLAFGLDAAYLINEGAGQTFQDLTRRSSGSGVNTPVWSVTAQGLALTLTTASAQLVTTTSPVTSVFTYLARIRRRTGSGNLCFMGASGDKAPTLSIDTGAGTGRPLLSLPNLANISYDAFDTTVDSLYDIGVSYSATGVYAFYRNGTPGDTGTNLQTVTTTSRTRTFGGGEVAADWQGDVGYAYYYSVVVPPQSMAWLAAEPYAFLRPILRRRYFVPAAGGARVVPRRLPMLGVGA